MRIVIDSIIGQADCKYEVIVKLENGNLKGMWKGNQIPLIGETYDAELSFPPVILLNSDKIESKVSIIKDHKVEFYGTCEDIDDDIDDDVYIIRFADNWIEIVDGINNDIRRGDNINFVLTDTDILIYPITF